tara:strand:- start:380 stop:607 length:228 start_codon:yes stop_codon:yes gene_type:complete
MINEFIFMDGYGAYVWSAFVFTIFSFITLYTLTKVQFAKEEKKFVKKFGSLNPKRAAFAKSQSINKEILSNSTSV